jgi:hypothetical protein
MLLHRLHFKRGYTLEEKGEEVMVYWSNPKPKSENISMTYPWYYKMIDILLLLIIVACAIFALFMKDLLSATIILGVYSFIMATIFTR